MALVSHTQGLRAEILAILLLFFKGYRILKWRYKTPLGEIDIVATRGQYLVCVEVKQRANIKDALEAVTPVARGRIARASRYYISRQPYYSGKTVRYDLIVMSGFKIRHLDNAWFEPT